MRRAIRTTVLARAGVLFVALYAAAPALQADRVVAIGDIHGAYEPFVAILQETGLIDKDLNWTGGKTTLVQTGDVLDRGPRSKDALDLIMSLTDKAAKQGGEVRSLLGNHETMIMMGDLRYVSKEDYQSYAAADSEKLRQSEYENYLEQRKKSAGHLHQQPPSMGETEKQAWMAAHPPGFIEMRQAFSPKGKYGTWLRGRDAVTQVGDTVFLHGGLSPQSPLKSIKDINDRVHKEIATWDDLWAKLVKRNIIWQYDTLDEAQKKALAEYQVMQAAGTNDNEVLSFLNLKGLAIISAEGPLWYRGYASEPDGEFTSKLDQLLKRFKARHIVVGHTIPNSKRIVSRYDDRVFMIDCGMLASYFQGRPAALESNGGHFKAIYVGEPAQSFGGEAKTQ